MLQFELNYVSRLSKVLKSLLEKQHQALDVFLKSHPKPSYTSFVPLLESQENELHQFWAPISHLNAVKNNEALRKSYEQCLPILSNHHTWLSHHQKLFEAFKSIKKSPGFKILSAVQKKYVIDSLRDFKLAGINLSVSRKKVFAKIQTRLSELANRFEQHVMDANDAWHLNIKQTKKLFGIPETILTQLKANAKATGEKGYLLNLHAPCFQAVITYADNRNLRKKMYEAYITRASEIGPTARKFDNTSIMFDILCLKHKLAHLLGFQNYAEYSLTTKMAKTPQAVENFLEKLIHLARPFAKKEFEALKIFKKTLARSFPTNSQLAPWDIAYLSEKLKQVQLHFDEEALRPYFPLPTVLKGLFTLSKKLFGIYFKAVALPKWHKDVQVFEVQNEQRKTIAYFYWDFYARPKKRSGAWMDDAEAYWNRGAQKPIAFLTCNFSPPLPNQPALLTHDEVLTLFHEFGHALHHMLTQVEVLALSGTHGVEWDAVELPSQLMENWCWQAEGLALISQHYQTKKTLPKSLLQALLKSKNFLSGMFLVRQLEYALFDLRLHWKFDPTKGSKQIQEILDKVRDEVSVVPISPLNRFQHSFAHIFAGAYASGYYSYLWAEVLSADAFSLFKEKGILSRKLGQHFKASLLSQGGSKEAAALFNDFRGRAPRLEPLLESYGLKK